MRAHFCLHAAETGNFLFFDFICRLVFLLHIRSFSMCMVVFLCVVVVAEAQYAIVLIILSSGRDLC